LVTNQPSIDKSWTPFTPSKKWKLKVGNKVHYKNIHISTCGQDFTKIRATRSIVMGDPEFNKC
jgi:hypothetical protein